MADEPPQTPIATALHAVQARIRDAAVAAGRDPRTVALVAVSKTHPAQAIEAALSAGQQVFGENRVQEAAAKVLALRPAWPALRLHLIGPLQTNKAVDAVCLADVIETLDRPRLADALDLASQKTGRLPSLLIQINIGDEPQKAGIAPDDADRFINDMRRRFGALLAGLMAIPPADRDPLPFFRRMAVLAEAHGLARLSMGMSGDFEAAIACGATSVRVGSAIFGARPAMPTAAGAPVSSPLASAPPRSPPLASPSR